MLEEYEVKKSTGYRVVKSGKKYTLQTAVVISLENWPVSINLVSIQ